MVVPEAKPAPTAVVAIVFACAFHPTPPSLVTLLRLPQQRLHCLTAVPVTDEEFPCTQTASQVIFELAWRNKAELLEFGYSLPLPLLLALAPSGFDLPFATMIKIAIAAEHHCRCHHPCRLTPVSTADECWLKRQLRCWMLAQKLTASLPPPPLSPTAHSTLSSSLLSMMCPPPSFIALLTNLDTTCLCTSSWSFSHQSLTCRPCCNDQNCRCT
jgi:hypothetical protein